MRHVCKDKSQGINPEPSDEVREAKKKKKGKKAKENAVAYFQTDAAQPGQRWHKNRFAYTELSGRKREFCRIYLTLIFREAFCGVVPFCFLLSERQLGSFSRRGL